jgi:uncharacterized protein
MASIRIGLISDTHGLLRPQAAAFLRGCDHIVHAGDVGAPAVLEALAAIAPLTAVRGNNDVGAWADALDETAFVRFGGIGVFVLHDLAQLDASAPPAQVVVSGHSHQPSIVWRDGVCCVNPGSAGPRRFRLPIAAAELTIDGSAIRARIVEFEDTRVRSIQP